MWKVFVLLGMGFVFYGCSDDEGSVPICDCEPDQYCVDDKCYDTDETIAPAPVEGAEHNMD